MLVLAGLIAAGCGTAAPRYLPGLEPLPPSASPTAVVQHAYRSLAHSSYDMVERTRARLDTSGLPAVEADRIHAKLGQVDTSFTLNAAITDLADFGLTEHTDGQTVYLKASHGVYSVSQDGVSYEQAPTDQARSAFDALQGDVTFIAGELRAVRVLGVANVD